MKRALRNELSFLLSLSFLIFFFTKHKPLAWLLGGMACGIKLLPNSKKSFMGQSVLITGGSRGLGFAIAAELMKENANIALIARDSDDLVQARQQLKVQFPNSTSKLCIIPCDVTETQALEAAFSEVETQFGQIDLVINNAGSIAVGPFEAMQIEDFEAQVQLQLYTVIKTSQLSLQSFRKQKKGQIANICSIAGNLPVPHMSTYCAAKSALAGLSETLTAELAPFNIAVTTVYPGLMQTGSPIQAVFKGSTEKEYAWFATGDVLPILSVSAQTAAKRILTGIRNKDCRVVFPWVTTVGMLSHSLFPETYLWLSQNIARFMPKGNALQRKTGAESRYWLERQVWYKPLQKTQHRAEENYNQHLKYNANFNLGV